jgi:diguanylate cyclase (GGDEF)-like protein/PAS domain S-box-containing protein
MDPVAIVAHQGDAEDDAQSDAIYRLLVQGVTDYAIYMLGPDGRVSSWNAGARLAKGYEAAEIIGQNFSRFYTEEDRAAGLPQRALETAAAQGGFEGEGWRLRRDGSRFWAHVVIDPIRGEEDGDLIGFTKITRDLTEQREKERRASEQAKVFRLLVQGVTDYAIYMLDPEGIVSNWNAGAERAKGYRAAEIVGRNFACFYGDDDQRKGLPQRALATARATGKFEGEGWRLRRDGSRFWAHVVIDRIHDEDGTFIGFAKITRDLTEQKRQADRMKTVAANLDLALTNMSQGLCLFDAQERLVLSNHRLHELLRLDTASIQVGSTLTDLLWQLHADPQSPYPVLADRVRAMRDQHLVRITAATGVVAEEVQRGDRAISISHRALPGGGWVSTLDDITERRQIEDRIIHLAHHDTLTALPNRTTFRERLQQVLERPAGSCALLFLDLDRFKPVNDMLGHPVGDVVLQATAARIKAQLRKSDFVARLGGDEFAVLMEQIDGLGDAEALCGRLIHEISQPLMVNGQQIGIGASIGIAFSPYHGDDPDTLLRNADLALYRAKQTGRGCHRTFEAEMEQVFQLRRLLEQDLRKALIAEEFLLHYQPVVDIAHGRVTGFEALLRWESPTRGRVSPADFIPFAEEVGLMPEIGDWVLRTACRDAQAWPEDTTISVNLSPTQFRRGELAERVMMALTQSGLPATRLELEITETAMIDDVVRATSILNELRTLGVRVALDDFGTGYSSLSFLRNLPFNRIKIDRSFVQDLGVKPEATAIVRAVTAMCSSLNVAVTAEGVETTHQIRLLEEQGCPEIQGFLISHPYPASEVLGWLGGASDWLLRCGVVLQEGG